MSTDVECQTAGSPAEPMNWEGAKGQDAKWFTEHLGSVPEARVGIGLSGGGIRSATFNLGILSVLREKGILKNVHYLSTVSGGGCIGSWLVGNTLRRPGFLDEAADWSGPVKHLLAYSNHLSPKLGFFSADSWTMAMIWLRNTLLVQLSLLSVLLLPLLAVRYIPLLLSSDGGPTPSTMEWAFVAAFLLAGGFVAWGLRSAATKGTRLSQPLVQLAILIPLFVAAFAFLPIMWKFAPNAGNEFRHGLSFVLDNAPALALPLSLVCAAFLVIAFSAQNKTSPLLLRIGTAVLSVAVAAAAFLLMLVRLLTWLPDFSYRTGGPDWGPYLATAFMVPAIRNRDERGFSGAHCAVGYVRYDDGGYGTIVYLKSSMTGDEPTELHQYKADHAAFPHEPTTDQFFSEPQFESYRRLGVHVAETALGNAAKLGGGNGSLEEFCVQLRKRWFPAQTDREAFAQHAAALNSLWEELRKDDHLRFLDEQFLPGWQNVVPAPAAPAGGGQAPADPLDLPADPVSFRKAFYFCTELIQLMENVYLDFDLESNESSPDLRGWMNLFRHWTWSYMFRVTWALTSPTYGARFQVFCERVFRLRPARGDDDMAARVPDAITLRLLEGQEAEELLNPVEKEIEASVRANGAAGAKLYTLALEVAHPVDSKRRRRLPTGFALCEEADLLYLRTQDHLRQTGLGGAFLDSLVKRAGIQQVRPVGPKDPALCEWTVEEVVHWVRRRYPGFGKGKQ
jgi:hypothetical protein